MPTPFDLATELREMRKDLLGVMANCDADAAERRIQAEFATLLARVHTLEQENARLRGETQ